MNTQVKKTITAVDKSTKAISKSAADLLKVATELSGLVGTSEELAFDIESKSSELAAIETKISEEERKAKAELNLRILENEEQILDKLLKSRGLAKVADNEVKQMLKDLETAQSDNADAIDAAVKAAETGLRIAASAEKGKLTSEHAVATATLTANASSLESRIAFLVESNTSLKDMLDAERTARVTMSQTQSQPVVNVNSGK
jgi:hypothetical protein